MLQPTIRTVPITALIYNPQFVNMSGNLSNVSLGNNELYSDSPEWTDEAPGLPDKGDEDPHGCSLLRVAVHNIRDQHSRYYLIANTRDCGSHDGRNVPVHGGSILDLDKEHDNATNGEEIATVRKP